MTRCIWCKKENNCKDVEHIIPDSLGCPEGFVLKNSEVCSSCNNKLSHLDQAIIDDFDILLFMNNVPRKKGRKAAIHSRGNLVARRDKNNEPVYALNMNPYPVIDPFGKKLAGIGKSKRNIKAKMNKTEGKAEISFGITIGNNPKFIRGIFKIAFSSLAYYIGYEEALLEKYDLIRKFVKYGKGHRKVLVKKCNDEKFMNNAWPPYISQDGEYTIIFRLASLEFCVDLSPNMSNYHVLRETSIKMLGTRNWTTLPPTKKY